MLNIGENRKILINLKQKNQLEFLHFKLFGPQNIKKVQITLLEAKFLPLIIHNGEAFSSSNGRRLIKIDYQTEQKLIKLSVQIYRENHFEQHSSIELKPTEYEKVIQFVKGYSIPLVEYPFNPSLSESE